VRTGIQKETIAITAGFAQKFEKAFGEISNRPLQVMVTSADNTQTAIINVVNSYRFEGYTNQRKLEIKDGVRRN
jgi:hypothetical protein